MKRTRKVGIIASAIASTAICASLIAGSTFALFTANDSVDISVTSGKIDVAANIVGIETYSPERINLLTYLAEGANRATTAQDKLSGTFVNGGTAKVSGGDLKIEHMMPGDKVTATVELNKENSTADFNYRVKVFCGAETNALYDNLLVKIGDEYYGNYVSEWKSSTTFTGDTATVTLDLELPTYVGDAVAGEECDISVVVEAVQGNAVVTNDESLKTYLVSDPALLDATVNGMKSGETVVLAGGNTVWNVATISYDDAKTVNVRGYHVGTLTVNAPLGTVNYYNEYTKVIDVQKIADHSMHIFGEVGENVTAREGRVVIEDGASVAQAIAAPAAGATATIQTEGKAEIKDLQIDQTSGGKAVVTVSEDSKVNMDGVKDDAIATVKTEKGISHVFDLESLFEAAALGGEVTLLKDITVNASIVLRAGVDLTIDFNGHWINYAPAAGTSSRLFYISDGAVLTVKGETPDWSNQDLWNNKIDTSNIAEGVGGVKSESVDVYGVFELYGTLNVYGGHYECYGTGGASIVRPREGSTIHIYNGSFVSQNTDGVMYNDGTATIENGFFYTNSSNRGNWSYCVQNAGGSMHIKNATVYGIQGGISVSGKDTVIDNCESYVREVNHDDRGDRSFYALYVNGNQNETACTVNGGTFKAGRMSAMYVGNPIIGDGGLSKDASAVVHGGTFIGGPGKDSVIVGGYNGAVSIDGGTFGTDVNKFVDLTAYDVVQKDDGMYVLENATFENVATGAELVAALEKGGHIRLTTSIALDETTNLNTYYEVMKDVRLDLNGHTLTTHRGFRVGKKESTAVVNFTVLNGTVVRESTSGNIAALSAQGYGRLDVRDCTVKSTQDTAISIFDHGKVYVERCNLVGVYYGFSSNAGAGNYSNEVYATLIDTKLDAQYAGLLWNIPAKLTVQRCEVKGLGQGLIARGGTINLQDTVITKRAAVEGDSDRAKTDLYSKYESEDWGTGSSAPAYALVVGNRHATQYKYPVNLTLNRVTVTVEDGVNEIYADNYTYIYNKKVNGVKITHGDAKNEQCDLGNIVEVTEE